MKTIVIVESPSKCKKIEYILSQIDPNRRFIVRACCGHFREIKSIDTESFDVLYQTIPTKKKYVAYLKKIIKSRDVGEIILATDNDREGEAIAWHICQELRCPVNKTKRLRFNEISKAAISNAYQSPSLIDMNLVHAQSTRQIVDQWIGFTFSPKLASLFRNKSLSAGRCQTPAVKLIYDNETKRSQASTDTLFHCTICFHPQHQFHLNHTFQNQSDGIEFMKQNQDFHHALIKPFETSTSYRYPPKGLTTSKLQQFCSTYWKWSPTFTMQQAQQLYENGHITYHRTESTQYNASFQKNVLTFIEETFGKEYKKKKVSWSENKNAHESIHPINVYTEIKSNRLYEFIRKTTIQSLMENATFSNIHVKVTSPRENYVFEKTFCTCEFEGFLKYDEKPPEKNIVPKTLSFEWIKLFEKHKEYIPHLNEAQVIQQLEKLGIGRPSTFASFISKILQRKYVSKEDITENTETVMTEYRIEKQDRDKITKKENPYVIQESQKLKLSDLGKKSVQYLYKNFEEFFDYDFTKSIEKSLDTIASGDCKKIDFLKSFYEKIKPHLTT